MKQHIHKLHNQALKDKLATNWYINENAWLDLTSSWSIKDIEKRYKTFPENHTGATMRQRISVLHKFLPNGQNMLRMYKAHNLVQ